MEIRTHPVLEINGFANVDNFSGLIIHKITAWFIRQIGKDSFNFSGKPTCIRSLERRTSLTGRYNQPMSIKVLSDTLASQIAAGEVIERPVSVVKELIENAIDAQASSINLVVEGAGKRLIAVSDNGVGISPADLPLAVARHATSKISRSEDLNDIRTLGFRGEALASIGSVSRLQIQSKQTSEVQGYCITVDGGDLSQPKACSTANGTIIRVQDLFITYPRVLNSSKLTLQSPV